MDFFDRFKFLLYLYAFCTFQIISLDVVGKKKFDMSSLYNCICKFIKKI